MPRAADLLQTLLYPQFEEIFSDSGGGGGGGVSRGGLEQYNILYQEQMVTQKLFCCINICWNMIYE